ncbi:uncharacterized protein FPRO_10937 [Fusarium proliferatum ET1]|uniref:DUF7730 domain-containing protein n=1 Tax=Fusarium proliferatum (strain ET1) TaxID=1227346 RepID=A0A1L7VLE8_FUSPR|nr:uncharacterized protein FPRO_10937 [Fusarium proliferatum ET1]CZR41348.1 uncharacterized protein FPRO_10937 [Fusarium proliferatum ET1]
MAIRFTDGLLQNQSPFFANVPPEIHDMILINLFGKRRLRIEWAPQQNGNDREHKARNRPNVLQWTHFLFFKGSSQHFHDDEDDQHWRYYLSSGFILTCKRAFERGIKILYQTNTFEFESMNEFMEFQRYQIAPDLNHLLTHIDTPVSIEFSDLVCYGSELEKTRRPQPIGFTMQCHTLSKMKQDLNLCFHVHMSNGEPWPRHTAESKRLAGQAVKVGLETLLSNGRVTCVIDGCGMDGFSEIVKEIWSKKLEGGLKLYMCPYKPSSRYDSSSEGEQDDDSPTDS